MACNKPSKLEFDFSRPRVRRNGRVLDKMALAILLVSLLYDITSYVEMRNLLIKIL